MEPNETTIDDKAAITAHLKTARVKTAMAKFGITATRDNAKAAVPAWLSTIFFTFILPILPSVLAAFGTKILANAKTAKILEKSYEVLGQLLGKTPLLLVLILAAASVNAGQVPNDKWQMTNDKSQIVNAESRIFHLPFSVYHLSFDPSVQAPVPDCDGPGQPGAIKAAVQAPPPKSPCECADCDFATFERLVQKLQAETEAAKKLQAETANRQSPIFNRQFYESSLIYWGGTVADHVSTGRQRELNPVVRNSAGQLDAGRFYALNAGVYGLTLLGQRRWPRQMNWARRISGLFSFAVAGHNWSN